MTVDLVEQLLRAGAYPHAVEQIQLRETHISWVFLTGEWAYKVKQPKDLGFLDFTSLAARKRFCQEELRLNRRFAPDLYLEVVPVCNGQGLHIGGEGEIVDYAVKMRQFDDRQLLSHIAEREGLDGDTIRELGRLLANTHAELHPVHPQSGPGTPLVLQDATTQNFEQIARYQLAEDVRSRLAQIERWSTHRLVELMPMMIRRIAGGFVKDCHGDLHLGNIARIDGQLCFFDCIEFSDNFRVMDTIAEAAFLVMDCQARGMYPESMRLLNDYLEYSGDYEGLALFDLYRCYYAMVRAKVSLLRLDRGGEAIEHTDAYRDFERYLALASSYTRRDGRFMAMTCGVSGSGKSTIAMGVVERTGAIRIRSDVERKRLFDLAPESRSDGEMQAEIYSKEASKRTFKRLLRLSHTILQAGFPCVVDATFLRRRQRKPFRKLARLMDVPLVIIVCSAGKSTLRKRIKARNTLARDASEADVAVMEQQLLDAQLPVAGEADKLIKVDGRVAIDRIVQQIRKLVPAAEG